MSADLDKVVYRYLKSRHLDAAANELAQNAAQYNGEFDDEEGLALSLSLEVDPAAINNVLLFASADGDYRRLCDAYGRLSRWAHASLEMYRAELTSLLFPVFAHLYLEMVDKWASDPGEPARPGSLSAADLHAFFDAHAGDHPPSLAADLASLRTCVCPSHLATNPAARLLRSARATAVVSPGALDLLMRFLDAAALTPVLAVLNEWVTLRVAPGAAGVAAARDGTSGGVANAAGATAPSTSSSSSSSSSSGPSTSSSSSSSGDPQQRQPGSALEAYMRGGGVGLGLGCGGYDAGRCNALPGVQWGVDRSGVIGREEAEEIRRAEKTETERRSKKLADGVALEPEEQVDVSSSAAVLNAAAAGRKRDAAALLALSDATTTREAVVNAHPVAGGPGACVISSHRLLLPRKGEVPTLRPEVAAAASVPSGARARRNDAARKRKEAIDGVLSRVPVGPKGPLPSACMLTLINTNKLATCSSLAPSTDCLAVGFSDGAVRLWDLAGPGKGPVAETAVRLAPAKNAGGGRSGGGKANSVSASASGPHNDDGDPHNEATPPPPPPDPATVRERLLAEHHHVPLIGHSGPVYSVDWSPCGQYLISSSADCTVRLWSMHTVSCVAVFRGHNHPVWHCAFSPCGLYIAGGGMDTTARVWRVDRPAPVRVMAGHNGDVCAVAFHPNGSLLATGSADRTARVWSVASGGAARIMVGHLGEVWCLAFSRDGRCLVSGASDGAIMFWDLETGAALSTTVGHLGAVWDLAFCHDDEGGVLMASAGADGTVRLWDTKVARGGERARAWIGSSRALVKTYFTRDSPVLSVGFTERNLILAVGDFRPPKK